MNYFPFTQDELERLMEMRKFFLKAFILNVPEWSSRHGDSKSYCVYQLVGESEEKFKTTIRTCGRSIESSYQNVTLIHKASGLPLARMDTGTRSHYDYRHQEIVNGPHVHIYDVTTRERCIPMEELLGHFDSISEFILAFWKHFNIDTGRVTVQGDLFYGENNF